jgi:tetratricopeptide (TPR) repeat protein
MESQYLDDIITAMRYYQAGDIQEATILATQISKLEPENEIVSLLLGNCSVVNGDFEKGILHYQKTLELNPDLRDAQLGLARIFLKLNRAKEAFGCFQILLSGDDMDIECLLGSAEALIHQNHLLIYCLRVLPGDEQMWKSQLVIFWMPLQ